MAQTILELLDAPFAREVLLAAEALRCAYSGLATDALGRQASGGIDDQVLISTPVTVLSRSPFLDIKPEQKALHIALGASDPQHTLNAVHVAQANDSLS